MPHVDVRFMWEEATRRILLRVGSKKLVFPVQIVLPGDDRVGQRRSAA
jgi:hypothetical protein